MILSHSFHFVKCGYTVFSPFFCGFCHLSHRPGTTSGVARKIGTGDARGKGKSLVFSLVSGANATVSRSLSANAPGGRPYSPENARSPFPLCRGDHPSPAFSRARSSPARLARTSPPSNNVQKRETPRRLPRNGFYLTSGFYRTFGIGFSRREPAPGDPLLRFRRYSAARTMRSGYTLLVRSVDPSGQIMSRTYPSSPNVTGISTVRVS